jgi:hypothetical protein
VRAFISSEMESPDDAARRDAAKSAIRRLGHIPVGFEDLPARVFPAGEDAIAACLRLVRGCQAIFVIVDDSVTSAMEAEIDEARSSLGSDRTFYYFTRTRRRDESAARLWATERDNSRLARFTGNDELVTEIERSIASFIDDAVALRPREGRLFDLDSANLEPGKLLYWRIPAARGDRIDATCTGSQRFYATLVNAAGFARLHDNPRGRGLATDSQRSAHHFDLRVDETGDYYLMIRGSIWQSGNVTVTPRVIIR